MIQELKTPQNKQQQIKELASALLSALGIKNSDDGEKVQSATIFLSKIFKKYSGQPGKKINEVKLNRLNGMLYKIFKDPPADKNDVEIIYQIILTFINNETLLIDDNSFASNTCIWIAKFLEQVLAVKCPEICVQLLEVLLKNKKPAALSLEAFQKMISESHYFKDKQITKNDEVSANEKCICRGFMSEYTINEQIKANLRLQILFQNLFAHLTNKNQVLRLFINYCRQTDVENMKEIFIKVFINKQTHSKQVITYIIQCLDTQFFSTDDLHEIIKLLLISNDRKIFYSLDIKGLKCQTRFVQILTVALKNNRVDELADAFISQKKTNNFYLIYLINKSNQRLSEKYLYTPLNNVVTNRQAIICALCISQNIEQAHMKILTKFFEKQAALTHNQKINFLKTAHFSFVNVPKSHLLTHIFKSISVPQLDQQSKFEFLPHDNYQKIVLQKNERDELNQFLNRYFGNTDQVYWIKLDLYSLSGKQLTYIQQFKKVQKIFEAPIDQIIQQLPNAPEKLLEIVLMGANNKLVQHFLVNQNVASPVIQWALQGYKKQFKKFKMHADAYLKRLNCQQFLEIGLQLLEYNLDQKANLQLFPELNIITSTENVQKLNGLNFSEYFMSSQTEPGQNSALLKSKNLVIEYQKLIRLLSNDMRHQNKKQIKTIISQQSTPLRALRILHLLSEISSKNEKLKDHEKQKKLVDVLLSQIKPQFEYLKQLETRSTQVNIPYSLINDSFEFLLSVSYENTINFLAKLLRTRPIKVQQKQLRSTKKNKRKAGGSDKKEQKLSEASVENIEFCFKGDPNSLSSYNSMIQILELIKNTENYQQIKEDLVKWISRIKIFHKQQYQSWKQKLLNYLKLWQYVSGLVANIVQIKQIQRHFLIMVDLLNTLYQKYKKQKDLLQIQRKLLNGIYMLYLMANASAEKNKMQEEADNKFNVPNQKLNQVIATQQTPELTIPHIYYCFDCSKKVCNDCVAIMHKNHDKNYIGPGNQNDCHRFSPNKSKQMDKRQFKEKYFQKLLKQGGIQIDRQRQLQRLEQLLAQSQNSESSHQILMALKEKTAQIIIKRNERQGLNFNYEIQEGEDELKKKPSISQQADKLQIRSCSQKQFAFTPSKIFPKKSKPEPKFQGQQRNIKNRRATINLTPLFNLLIRQLKSNSFYSIAELEVDQKGSQFQAQLSNQKYTIIKVDNFKNNLPKVPAGTYMTAQTISAYNKRNVVTVNEKFVAILSGSLSNGLIYYLDSNALVSKFNKKEAEKRYRQNDVISNYQMNQNNASQVSVSQIQFCPFSDHVLAQIANNKIFFSQISRDGRNKLICYDQSNADIVKFQIIKTSGLKSFFAYLANQIVIGKYGKKQIQYKQKVNLAGKKIKDFSHSSLYPKQIFMAILDNQNKIYRAKIDIYHRKVPNFLEFQINFPTSQTINSILCQNASIFCTTVSGKIIMLNLNQENTLASPAITFPIIEQLRSHKISEASLKFKQISKIVKLKYVTKNQNEIYMACLLMKDNPNDLRKIGFFVLLSLNIQSMKSKIILYNDQGTTDSYDWLKISQRQFLFICLQEDGEVWSCKLNTQSKSNLLKPSDFTLGVNDIVKYGNQLQKVRIVSQIEFYFNQRKPSFKQHQKVTEHFKVGVTDTSIKFQKSQKYAYHEFLTGIEFSFVVPEGSTSSNLVFKLFGNVYRFSANRTRQIQIPFLMKQVMSLFTGQQQLVIQFLEGNPLINVNAKDISVFGIKSTQKSLYLESFTSICELLFIYKEQKDLTPEKKLEVYFLNERRNQFSSIQRKTFDQYLTRKKFSLTEQNFLIKLQLLRESVQNDLDSNFLSQCYEAIRNHLLPNCLERRQILLSIYKLYRKLTASAKDQSVTKIGHPLNFQTQLDIYNTFRTFRIFKMESTIDNYQDLLIILSRIINSRTANAFIILSVYPQILKQVYLFFKRIMIEYKLYFRANQNGLEKDEKIKLIKICSLMMRVLIENYELQKNKYSNSNKNCQEQLLRILQSVFCLSKRQIHREIKLNPFQFLNSVFEYGEYKIANPPLNILQLEKIEIQEVKKPAISNQMPQQRAPNSQIPNSTGIQNAQVPANIPSNQRYISNEQEGGEMDQQFQQSYQEHKQREQENREMLEDFQYQIQMQQEANQQGLLQEDDYDIDSLVDSKGEEYSKFTEINTKKIYDYLGKAAQGIKEQSVTFTYYEVCENLLLQIFKSNPNNNQSHKYLTTQNLVLYVGLVYNLIYMVQKKLTECFNGSNKIDPSHPYVDKLIMPILEEIDDKIDNPAYSVLYLPISSIISINLKNKNVVGQSMFVQCLIHYYRLNIHRSKLLSCFVSSAWHPTEHKNAVSLGAVLRFQYFDLVNPIYQLKYVGNLYLNLRPQKLKSIQDNKQAIQQNILKVVVKYNLRIYDNIMISQGWNNQLQKTKINVAFQELNKNNKIEQSLKTILKSLQKNAKILVENLSKDEQRVLKLESLLGISSGIDQKILQILNTYYSYEDKN